MKKLPALAIAFVVSVIPITAAVADTIKVAVASNFIQPAKQLKTLFEQQSEHRLQLSFASTGKLYAQILHGAPYDVFLAADQQRPKKLEQQQKILPGSRFTYAVGRLAVCSSGSTVAGSPVEELLRADRISLANPKTAPYGVAAVEVLKHFEVFDKIQQRLVYAENVAQSLHYVHTSTVGWGVVAEAMLTDEERHSCWLPPKNSYQPINQDVVALNNAKGSSSVAEFLRFLKSTEVQAVISRYGYDIAKPALKI